MTAIATRKHNLSRWAFGIGLTIGWLHHDIWRIATAILP